MHTHAYTHARMHAQTAKLLQYTAKLFPTNSIFFIICESLPQKFPHLRTAYYSYICDRICKKGSYTRNYKYLEIPI